MSADKTGKIITDDSGFLFSWKAADTADNSIIAYGYCNYTQGRKPDMKKYKIVFRKGTYQVNYLSSKTYFGFANVLSLADAQREAIKHWVEMWRPRITEVEFEEAPKDILLNGNYSMYDPKCEQIENKAISADLSPSNSDAGQSNTLYNTINPDQYYKELTENVILIKDGIYETLTGKIELETVHGNCEPGFKVIPFAKTVNILANIVECMNAYKAAYHALNKPATDLQTRLDIAASLKQYES